MSDLARHVIYRLLRFADKMHCDFAQGIKDDPATLLIIALVRVNALESTCIQGCMQSAACLESVDFTVSYNIPLKNNDLPNTAGSSLQHRIIISNFHK
jgi:hypothetical protein